MTDPTLAQLILAAEADPGDGASLAALADRLLEASAADRVEALRGWARLSGALASAEARLETARDTMNGHFRRNVRRSAWRQRVWPGAEEGASAVRRYAERELRLRASRALGDAVEAGRWYAVRFGRAQTPAGFAPDDHAEVIATLDVSPLDGGRVDLPGGET